MFQVSKYIDGVYHSAISGMGRNSRSWDYTALSRRTAQRWAAKCRADDANCPYALAHYTYKVEEN